MFTDEKPGDMLLHDSEGADAPSFLTWADAPVETPPDRFSSMPDLLQLTDPEADSGQEPEGLHLPPPGMHTSGTQLRHRIVTQESIDELATREKPSFFQRLFRRK